MTTDRYETFVTMLDGGDPTTMRFGLEAMRAASGAMALEQLARRVVIVAGTNGKGTTASYLHAIGVEAGLRVGLYTSPHLVDFRERFRVNGEPISRDDVVRIGEPLLDRWRNPQREATPRRLTWFELTTLMGFQWFMEQSLDLLVVEVGLGGRLDATNILDADAAIFTTISLEHQEYLGDTIEAIAAEKAAVARAGRPAFVHAAFSGSDPLQRELRSIGAVVDVVEAGVLAKERNAALAARCFRALFRAELKLSEAALDGVIERGVSRARWPGRQEERVVNGQSWVIDGAHNAESAAELARWLEATKQPPMTALVALSGERKVDEVLAPLRPFVSRWVVTAPRFARARSISSVVQELELFESSMRMPLSVNWIQGVGSAVHVLANEERILAFGSLYLVGELLAALGDGSESLPAVLAPRGLVDAS